MMWFPPPSYTTSVDDLTVLETRASDIPHGQSLCTTRRNRWLSTGVREPPERPDAGMGTSAMTSPVELVGRGGVPGLYVAAR